MLTKTLAQAVKPFKSVLNISLMLVIIILCYTFLEIICKKHWYTEGKFYSVLIKKFVVDVDACENEPLKYDDVN